MPDESGGFKGLLIGFILFGLFGFLVLTAISSLATEYSKDTTDVLDGTFSLDEYEAYTDDVKATADKRGAEFQQDEPFSSGEIVVSGIFNVGLGLIDLIFTPFRLLNGVIFLIVDNSALALTITGVLSGILIVTIMFGLWRVLKTGD